MLYSLSLKTPAKGSISGLSLGVLSHLENIAVIYSSHPETVLFSKVRNFSSAEKKILLFFLFPIARNKNCTSPLLIPTAISNPKKVTYKWSLLKNLRSGCLETPKPLVWIAPTMADNCDRTIILISEILEHYITLPSEAFERSPRISAYKARYSNIIPISFNSSS